MGVTVLFGGTFNPPHIGHYKMLAALQNLPEVDRISVIPNALPPHKLCDDLASDDDRLAMCRLFVRDFDKATVDTLEIDRAGKSYTADTVRILRQKNPETVYAVAIGGDMAESLETWHDWPFLKKAVGFYAFARKTSASFQAAVQKARQSGASVTVVDADIPAVSSTEIRRLVHAGELPCNTIPAVAEYVRRHHLYLGISLPEYAEYIEMLRNRLKPKRFYHSLCVADEALRLAIKYGADLQKAYLSGLLHDITKNADKAEHFALFQAGEINLSAIELSAEKLWHAASGAIFLEKKLNITDAEILTAVRLHTTADEKMPLLAKVLYLADFTSADRDYEDVETMRQLVDESMENAMCYALRYTVLDLASQNRAIHPKTIAAFNEMMLKRSENNGN